MFNDFSEILKEFLKNLLSSRLVLLSVVFVGLYAILGIRLFKLQIIVGEHSRASRNTEFIADIQEQTRVFQKQTIAFQKNK